MLQPTEIRISIPKRPLPAWLPASTTTSAVFALIILTFKIGSLKFIVYILFYTWWNDYLHKLFEVACYFTLKVVFRKFVKTKILDNYTI